VTGASSVLSNTLQNETLSLAEVWMWREAEPISADTLWFFTQFDHPRSRPSLVPIKWKLPTCARRRRPQRAVCEVRGNTQELSPHADL